MATFLSHKHAFMLAVSGMMLATGTANAQKWIMASGYADTFYHTGNIEKFLADAKEASGGKLDFTLHKNQTVIKLPQIKRAVQTEQVQLGEILMSQYGNEDPLYEINDIPFLADDFDKAEKLWKAAQPILEKHFAQNGIRLLYEGPWPTSGFYFKEPVTSLEQLKGSKMRVYSPMTQRMGQLMGTNPVLVPFADVPQAFTTNIVDSMFTAPQLGISLQAWEFVKAYTDVGSHVPMNVVIVNEAAFKKLTPDAQKAILDAAAKAKVRAWELARATTNTQKKMFADKGMRVTQAPPQLLAQLQPIGKTLLDEWLKKAGSDGAAIIKAYQQ